MAKKKVAPQTNEHTKSAESIYDKFDMHLLTHKYSDYYISKKESDENLAQMGLVKEGDENDEGDFVWYDTREVFYPVYKTIIDYQITTIQPIHPIIIAILKSVKYLETLKNANIAQKLKSITQLDDEIYGSIIAELITKGLLNNENDKIRLSNKGKDALKKEKEKIVNDESAVVAIDGIYNEVLEVVKSVKEMNLPHKPSKDSIELKPLFKARPRSESLYEEFSENKTLYQVLVEALQGLDSVDKYSIDDAGQSERQSTEVSNILAVRDVRKFYKKYICLFYKNAHDEEKILVVDERYEINAEITKLFDRLISEQNLTPSNANSNAWKDKEDKRERLSKEVIESRLKSALDLSEGAMLEVGEHKRYFIYVLKNAKKHIYIQSPWVRHNVLEIYKEYIQSALEKGVKITIKYGMQKRGEKDKQEIDEKALAYLNELKAKYGNFSLKHGSDDHSKIIICDDEFMIVGSFNWLSFAPRDDKRSETSTINKNKESIKKQIAKFD
ncbi:phospholipase D-like domain-containing protein [Helicobacter macacae]|uniref:PLD phosphodiesterase domain-containing protein n=1 Tax=Helicobacter macacae MIT 99-5501 TaxID=1357400 RepID=V8CE38_9HELI|nr:phospholipase D-like domain-containing protein [Helicobacter macacae]ETD24976.1 hypothetical protein HMPREF2086_00311 [Helicobacter macacae MIT 99-5501]